jgi:hypothetical protein
VPHGGEQDAINAKARKRGLIPSKAKSVVAEFSLPLYKDSWTLEQVGTPESDTMTRRAFYRGQDRARVSICEEGTHAGNLVFEGASSPIVCTALTTGPEMGHIHH